MASSGSLCDSVLFSSYNQDDFKQLIEGLFNGDPDAAAKVDADYRDRLVRMVARKMDLRLIAKEDPEDIVQSVMKTFFRRAGAGEFEFAHPGALWCLLRQIAFNKLVKHAEHWRAEKRNPDREEVLEGDPFPQAPTEAQAQMLGDAIEAVLGDLELQPPESQIFRMQLFGHSMREVVEVILSSLEEPYPKILQLRLQGLSEREVAESLGLTREAVRFRLGRIKNILARKLDSDGSGSLS